MNIKLHYAEQVGYVARAKYFNIVHGELQEVVDDVIESD